MADADTLFVQRAMRRIFRGMLVLSAAGGLGALWLAGWRNGISFLLGAAGAYLNLYWLHRLVETLGPGGRRPRKSLLIILATRYLLLGLAGYVIVKVLGLGLVALLLGLFVSAAAVLAEILYELTYAGT